MPLPRLLVETREIDSLDDPILFASPHHPLAWLRRGDGVVAVGHRTAAELRVVAGEDAPRTARLASLWRKLVESADIDDPLGLPGTGLVGLGALVFDEGSAEDSVLTVPSALVGRHGGRTWATRVRTADGGDPEVVPIPYGPHWAGTLGPGAQTPEKYQDAVRRAVARIRAGAYSKVVLARELQGTVPRDADLRRLLRALSEGYPDTWAFAVDGLIGASPETLVTVRNGTVTARVLAGTIGRGADPDADAAAAARLASSTKDLDEHGYAVRSLLASLRPHTRALASSEDPFLLKLPNLFHLATDVEGELADSASALDLVAALHPTAAVAGTPTTAALAAIREFEPFDRGRYAGPVGWVDAAGNGEWAIALRCAQFREGSRPDGAAASGSGDGGTAESTGTTAPGTDRPADSGPGASDAVSPADAHPVTGAAGPTTVTAYAGAGIVAASDPESELLETRMKFRPLVDALA